MSSASSGMRGMTRRSEAMRLRSRMGESCSVERHRIRARLPCWLLHSCGIISHSLVPATGITGSADK